MRWPAVLLVVAPLLLPAPARGGELEQLLAQLTRRGEQTRTLQGRFVQRKRLHLFRSEVVTSGRFYYQQPDRLRWETLPPEPSALVVLGQRAELRLPGEQPRVVDLRHDRVLGALVQQLMIWLGARPARELMSWYRARYERRGERHVLHLSPTAATLGQHVARVEVTFTREQLLETVRVEQRNGDRSVVEFSALARNAPVPAGMLD